MIIFEILLIILSLVILYKIAENILYNNREHALDNPKDELRSEAEIAEDGAEQKCIKDEKRQQSKETPKRR